MSVLTTTKLDAVVLLMSVDRLRDALDADNHKWTPSEISAYRDSVNMLMTYIHEHGVPISEYSWGQA